MLQGKSTATSCLICFKNLTSMYRNYIWELSLKGVVKLPTIAPTLFMIVWWRRQMKSKVIINADQWMFLSVRLMPTTKIIVPWYLSKKTHEFHRGSRNLFGAPRCSETLARGHFLVYTNLAEHKTEQSIKSYRMVIDSHWVHINNITHIMFFSYHYVSFS